MDPTIAPTRIVDYAGRPPNNATQASTGINNTVEIDRLLSKTAILGQSELQYLVDGLYRNRFLENVDLVALQYILAYFWVKYKILPMEWLTSNIEALEKHPLFVTGNSNVFRGDRHGRPVALKFIRPHIDKKTPEVVIKEFIREVVPWSLFNHRHILPFLGVHVESLERLHIAMVSDYMKNGTLLHFFEQQPDADRIRMLRGVADGLRYMHNLPNPAIHGDLRAMNILVDDDGEPLIADFGCASIRRRSVDGLPAQYDPALSGTLRWMPAERLRSGPYPISEKSDVYSFACLCVEVFTGLRPFDHLNNDGAVIIEIIVRNGHPRRPVGPAAQQLDDTMWDMLLRCWAPDPSHRPSMSEVYEFLASRCSDLSGHVRT